MSIHPVIASVTDRIRRRSQPTRQAYLERMTQARRTGAVRMRLPCANLAHACAASGPGDKAALTGGKAVNLAIVSAYNDMLSAHQPLETYPALIKQVAAQMGAVAQFAGGVPAMCDGVTQGQVGMELARQLQQIPSVQVVPQHVETNIVIFQITDQRRSPAELVAALKQEGVLINAIGGSSYRAVTHLNISTKQVDEAGAVFARVLTQ